MLIFVSAKRKGMKKNKKRDIVKLQRLIDMYGYWSANVEAFNSSLIGSFGHTYMTQINLLVTK